MRYILTVILMAGWLVGCDDSTTTQAQAPTPTSTSEPAPAPTPDPTPDSTPIPTSKPTSTPCPTITPAGDEQMRVIRGQALFAAGVYKSGWEKRYFPCLLSSSRFMPNGYHYDLALRNQTEAIRVNPTNALAYYIRGFAHFKLAQYEQANQDFDEAIRLDPSLKIPALSPAEIVKRSRASVVRINPSKGCGSGVLLGRGGLILTNHHVVDGQEILFATTDNGTVAPLRVVASDPSRDLALVQAITTLPEPAPLVWEGDPKFDLGTQLFVLGYHSCSDAITVIRGIFSGRTSIRGQPVLQTDAWLNAGVSGGLAVSPNGRPVGIAVTGLTEVENVGFLIPSSEVQAQIKRWLAEIEAGRLPWACQGSTPSPTMPPTHSQIAFFSGSEIYHGFIYVMDADGGNVRRLTEKPLRIRALEWSPDGTQIAIWHISRNLGNSIYVMNADGCNLRELRTRLGLGRPAWSPDGTRIAFSDVPGKHSTEAYECLNCPSNYTDIYVMDADGGNVRQLTDIPGGNWSPQWSPDGTRIVFGGDDIYVMDADGGNVRQLTDYSAGTYLGPAWSPDGTRITFVESSRRGSHSYVMDADGGNVRQLTENMEAADWGAYPPWSPDGTRIVFAGDDDIYVMDVDEGNVRRVTDDPGRDRAPAWSADGTKIAFVRRPAGIGWGDIYIMDADGSNVRQLTDTPGWEFNLAWSPVLHLPTTTSSPTTQQQSIELPPIAAIPPNLPAYSRSDWRHWTDDDGDCQNTRHEVLIDESQVPVTFKTSKGCQVATGRWWGAFTNTTVMTASKLDIDQLVPLKNAHLSGGWAWDTATKRRYANVLTDETHLIAVTASANRSKGARGPDQWKPPNAAYWCTYATDWIGIKTTWSLTVTPAEAEALIAMLKTCGTAVDFQDYDEAIRLDPEDARAYYNRGTAYSDLGGHQRAIQDFDEAIRLDPQYSTAYISRGIVYMRLGKLERAIQDYDEAIRLDPEDARAYFNRGRAHSRWGQYILAIDDYDEAIRLNPQLALVYTYRGIVYYEVRHYHRAIQDFDEAIRLDPKAAVSYFHRGNTYANLGQHQRAIQDYDESIRLNPKAAVSYLHRGLVYEILGQMTRANQDYETASRLNPSLTKWPPRL